MPKFNIKEVIEYYKPSIPDLAKLLFPTAKYPKAAFDRVLRGEALLNVEHLETIADFLGIAISDLFNPDSWKGIAEEGHIVFIKGAYKARINYKNSFLSLYSSEDNTLISQCVLNIRTLTLNELIIYLDNLIKNLKSN